MLCGTIRETLTSCFSCKDVTLLKLILIFSYSILEYENYEISGFKRVNHPFAGDAVPLHNAAQVKIDFRVNFLFPIDKTEIM